MKVSFLTAALVFLLGACRKQDAGFLNREIELKQNEPVLVDRKAGLIMVAEKIFDSRCPEGSQCFWEGYATAKIKATYVDKEVSFDLCTGGCRAVRKATEQIVDVSGVRYAVKLIDVKKTGGAKLKAVVRISGH